MCPSPHGFNAISGKAWAISTMTAVSAHTHVLIPV